MRKLSELLETRGLTFSQFCEHVCVCSVLVISHVREHIEHVSKQCQLTLVSLHFGLQKHTKEHLNHLTRTVQLCVSLSNRSLNEQNTIS